MNPPGAPLVVATGLVKTYVLEGKTIEVLRGIDLTIARGEVLALTGASGAGKSTLLHLLGALDVPTAGTITLDGQDLARVGPQVRARIRNEKVGFVFQFHHLLPEFSALENVAMPGLIGRRDARAVREAAREALEAVGLGHRLDHRPSELSGGEQQRVAVARAFVLRPELLLADEPTGNLDEQTAEDIHGLLLDLNQQYRTALVIATHHSALARRLPRQVALAKGRLAEVPHES